MSSGQRGVGVSAVPPRPGPGSLSWAAATWTVPGVSAFVFLLAALLTADEARLRLMTLIVLAGVAVVAAVVLAVVRSRIWRGVAVGSVVGAVVTGALVFGVLR